MKRFILFFTIVALFFSMGLTCFAASQKYDVFVDAKKQEGTYSLDAYGTWYEVSGNDLLVLGCADPIKNEMLIKKEVLKPGAEVVNGYVRLTWPNIDGAAAYIIDRDSPSGYVNLGKVFMSGSPLDFFDFSADMNMTHIYRIAGIDDNGKQIKSYKIGVKLPSGEKMPLPNNINIKIWGVSFKNNLLTVKYNIPKGVKVRECTVNIKTKSGKTLLTTMPDNYQIFPTEGKVSIKFDKNLVRGDFTANISLNIWSGGDLTSSKINPYAIPTLKADFSTK